MEHARHRLSIILPAHNAGAFLRRSVESVQRQSVTDWELLIIENGSADNTAAVAEELTREDSRIRLYHSDTGVSHARNEGIRRATGTYCTFLDADDWLLPEALAFFLESAEAHPDCDILMGATDRQAGDRAPALYKAQEMESALAQFLCQPTRYLTAWGKLYRTAFLQESGVWFDPALTHAEDSDYLIRLLGVCRQLMVTAHPVYHYSINPHSAVRSGRPGLEESYRISLETTRHRLPFGAVVRRAYVFYILDNLLVLLTHHTFRQGIPAAVGRQQAAAVLGIPVFREALETAPLQETTLMRRVAFSLARHRRLRLLQWAVRVRQWQKSRHN